MGEPAGSHSRLIYTVPATQRISEYTVESLLAATCDALPSPGSGSAGAVALALAASCAAKAANISLKHDPHDQALRTAARTFEALAFDALKAGDEDANAFERYISNNEAPDEAGLVQASAHLASLVERLEQTMRSVEARIDAVVAGDFVAARALSGAAKLIQVRNRAEMKRE
jgi:hypothetical protein